ncbi:hypothetical protein PG994_009769 [Apiospora phragmitis]|uniref:Arylsulfatase n=1 Tax=Apiospora phragmitis TaxID=2905665 RepID=A0ABR1U719_9PEZI
MFKEILILSASTAVTLAQIWTGGVNDDDAYHDQAPLRQSPPIGPKEQSASRPNIVLILTDDQDLHMDSMDYMPYVKEHLISHGTFYKKHFCTTALCCPSRATLLTGKAAHNTNVTNVVPPYGGYPKFVSQGLNDKYLPVWLQDAGYNTYYTGKLFNAHSVDNYNSPHAAGWTSSDFLLDPFTYWYMNSTYQRNADEPVSYEGRHSVEVLTEKALDLLGEAIEGRGHDRNRRPFFLGIAPVAPHANIWSPNFAHGGHSDIRDVEFTPPVPMARHRHLFEGARVPRTRNFNPDEPSGASWIRTLPRQTPENVDYNDQFYRQRLQALQGVDELVDAVVEKLERNGLLDNTYIFYTTDNGYHIGQHRLQPAKQCRHQHFPNRARTGRASGSRGDGRGNDAYGPRTDVPLDRGCSPRSDFDGLAIPLPQKKAGEEEEEIRHEYVAVEHWGFASNEGRLFDGYRRLYLTIRTRPFASLVRRTTCTIRSGAATSASCTTSIGQNEEPQHRRANPEDSYSRTEADDQSTGPGRRKKKRNALNAPVLGGVPLNKMVSRLDSLLFVLKSCRPRRAYAPGKPCTRAAASEAWAMPCRRTGTASTRRGSAASASTGARWASFWMPGGPEFEKEEEGQIEEALRYQAAWHEWT